MERTQQSPPQADDPSPARVTPTTSRRNLLKLAGATGAALSLPSLLAACGAGGVGKPTQTLKIGMISPRTGVLAGFTETDDFVMSNLSGIMESGINAGNSNWGIEVAIRDTQSDQERTAQVTEALIDEDESISMIIAANSPDTVLPVATVCEARGMPCLTTIAPWQQWANNFKEAEWAYHFYYGNGSAYQVFLDMWNTLPNNKTVGALWPDDPSGSTWSNKQRGFPAALDRGGFRLVDPGRYPNSTGSFDEIINQFRDREVDLVTGSSLPADFATFWKQAQENDFKPVAATMTRANQNPAFMEAMSPSPEGLSIAAAWAPTFPYSSSLTGASSQAFADEFTSATGKQWLQPLAYTHTLFEVAVDALKRADDPTNHESVARAIGETNLSTIVGPINFEKGPAHHVAETPLVGAQWRTSPRWPFELQVVHSSYPDIPTAGTLRSLR